jgi:prolipoprotein diacylglyceryl transferase
MEILRFPGLGWEIPISRVAVSIGSLEIYWYGVIIAVGFGLGLWVYLSHNRSCGIHPDEGLDIILWSMLGAIVGARAYYVAFQWDHYKDNLKEIFNLRGGGLAIYGGIIGALIVAFIVCRSKKLPMLPVADAAFPGVMLGQAIGRWGNFFNMEAFGTNTTLPWGMTSDTISNYLSRHQAALLAQGVVVDPAMPVHPTFLYESLWNLIGVAVLLLWLFPRRSYDGQITLGYTAWYGLGRFFVEGLRTDSLMWGSVRVSQALGGVLFIVAAGLMLAIFLWSRKPMTLEYIEGEKKPRFVLRRYVDTEESRQRMAMLDRKLAEKKNGKKPTQPEEKEDEHERKDH